MRFHHIGIACQDIIETQNFVNKTFPVVATSKVIFDPRQNVELCLLTLDDDSHIELVAGKTVAKFVEKKQFLYHTCWQVRDIDESIGRLYDNGAMLISAPQEAVLFDYRRVAFLFSELGIIELLEEQKNAI